MNTANIKLYDIFRTGLKLPDGKARELVQTLDDTIKEQHTMQHERTIELIHKDMQSLKDYIDGKFAGVDAKFANNDLKFATKEDLAGLRTELTRTIYLTSLGQLIAIIASVISLVMILKK